MKEYWTTTTRGGHPVKIRDRLRMTLVREVTKMPTITLKELERSAPHMGEGHSQDQPSTHTHTPQSWALWKSYPKKSIIEKKRNPMLETQQMWKKHSLVWWDEIVLALTHSTAFTRNPALFITLRTTYPQWSMMVEASCRDWELVKVEGKMGGTKHRVILEENLFQSTRDLRLGRMFSFQQDNDPKSIVLQKLHWSGSNPRACFKMARSKPRSESYW